MNSYWSIPEDIKAGWARAIPQIQEFATRNGGKLLTFQFVCLSGIVQQAVEPIALPMEPISQNLSPGRSFTWWQVIRALQRESSHMNGRGLIQVSILVSAQGEPVLWTRPVVSGMERVERE